MANTDNLFREFDSNLQITKTKKDALIKSKDNLRKKIRDYFEKEHPKYLPSFYIQGSYKTKTLTRTKDDTCDLDDGVFFKSNPDNVTPTTLQRWVKEAVEDVTDANVSHRKKCITVDYAAGYNIDLPVFLFDEEQDDHPLLAIKDEEWGAEDDPKEFIEEFKKAKKNAEQLVRIVKYLKTWCDYKRQKMPSGLVMTVLAMKHLQKNERDDVAMKYTLVEIEKELIKPNSFKCILPTTPQDDLFADYDDTRKNNFLDNLAAFITDAKEAVDKEKNQLKASKLWQKHFGNKYFPDGEDKDEKATDASLLAGVIGTSKPYCGK